MNKIIVTGRLTRDPAYKRCNSVNGEFRVSNFNLAVRRNGSRDTTDFFRIKAFNGIADSAFHYLHQGMRIMVEGELQISSYPDRETGEKKTLYEIVAQRLEFMDYRREESSQEGNYPPPAPEGYDGFMGVPEDEMDDTPFR